MTINYGDLIRMRRKDLGLTQVQLAERANVNRVTVWAIENDKRSVGLDCFLSVCNALNMKMAFYEIEEDS